MDEFLPEQHHTKIWSAYIWCRDFLFGTKKRQMVTSVVVLLVAIFYFAVYQAPYNFPQGHIVAIEKGMTLEGIGARLESEGVIRSPLLFRSAVIILGGEKKAYAGSYFFDTPEGVFHVAYRVAYGVYNLTPIVVRIPEGLHVAEIAARLADSLDTFDANRFISLAKADEGYLFPDTYHFLPNVSEEEVYRTMRDNFDARINTIAPQIEQFGKPLNEVVIMASIIEREAPDPETKRKVSSVLWNRIRIGMSLQVDASFVYLLGKGTAELSLDDLTVDSPYNTYTHTGLPPTPIANPGLDALLAAVTPIQSKYLYYLSDGDGNTYFSETFEEHKQKKAQYLK